MLAELDYGVGNVSDAVAAAGFSDRVVWLFSTDNGGPGSHACNWPLRGGKFSFWEGGVRGVAFVSSPLIPKARHGTQFDGLAHVSDWYRTVVEGIGNEVSSHVAPTADLDRFLSALPYRV